MKDASSLKFWDKAVQQLRSVLRKIGSSDDEFMEDSFSAELVENDRNRLISQMRACLASRGGEVSARTRAAALGHVYLALNEIGRKVYLEILAEEFGPDIRLIEQSISEFNNASSPGAKLAAHKTLKNSIEPPRLRLLTQFNALPQGVKFLVDMRAELLEWKGSDIALQDLDSDLKGLLASWFDVGFLELKQITWEAPALLLEKLFVYEAVHAIKSWDDLKNRLGSDRRCFAFFHPRMPHEPLIFVWVALVKGISSSIGELLDENAPVQDIESADCAVFYSISNAQVGLTGINFGNFLIKRVVDELSLELKGLSKSATLSPLPGFSAWIESNLEEKHLEFVGQEQLSLLNSIDPGKSLTDIIVGSMDSVMSFNETEKKDLLKPILLRLAAHYLILEKRRKGTALDSVAHFHLNNGAKIERINWEADTSKRGILQSAGIMVNYLYILDEIEENHENYRSGNSINTSREIRELLLD